MARFSDLRSLLTVFVFFILAVSSVGSYQCMEQQCTSESCSSSAAVCETTVGCFNQIQKFDTPFSTTDRLLKEKGCSTEACRELEFSATLGAQQTFTYLNRCCEANQCNKDDLSVPPRPSEHNGVQCPACYSEKEEKCSSVTTLKCTGKETKCVEIIGTKAGSPTFHLYGKGCATENACNLNVKVFSDIQIKSTCISNSGSPTLKSISSVPIILLLLKVFL